VWKRAQAERNNTPEFVCVNLRDQREHLYSKNWYDLLI
jgi:hypothetical protein